RRWAWFLPYSRIIFERSEKIMSHPIADLLKRALLVGAREVRLIPGRRTIVVVPAGESEVKGDAHTSQSISSLIAPVLTPAARGHMTTGFAEWDFELEG